MISGKGERTSCTFYMCGELPYTALLSASSRRFSGIYRGIYPEVVDSLTLRLDNLQITSPSTFRCFRCE